VDDAKPQRRRRQRTDFDVQINLPALPVTEEEASMWLPHIGDLIAEIQMSQFEEE